MKHKKILQLLSALMVFVLLSGCVAAPDNAASQPPVQDSALPEEPTEASPTESAEPTDPQPFPETDLFTACGHAPLPEVSPVPAYFSPAGTPHLYMWELPTPTSFDSSVAVVEDTLHCYYWNEGYYCELYDLTTGESSVKIDLSNFNAYGPLSDGGLWGVEYGCQQVRLYDSYGQETSITVNRESASEDPLFYTTLVDRSGRYLIMTYESGDLLEVYDLQTGVMRQADIPEYVTAGYLRQTDDGKIILDTYGQTPQLLDPQTLAITPLDGLAAGTPCYNGVYCIPHDTAMILSALDENSTRAYMKYADTEQLQAMDYGCAVTSISDMDSSLRFYDLRNQLLLNEYTFSDGGYVPYAQFMSNGMALVANQTVEGFQILLYDFPAAAAEARGEAIELTIATDEALLEAADEIAAQVLETTGVELLYGSEGNDFIAEGYVGVAELDPYTIYDSVSQIRDILLLYPDGMLREAWEPFCQGMKFYLCNTIYGVQYGALDTAGAITSDIDGYIVIALNVEFDLGQNLSHELSHAFERRIERVQASQGINWLELWAEVTPVPDPYLYSYVDYAYYPEYTAKYDSGSSDIWFIDTYSRTFPTEDRAKIMEHLFNIDDPESAEYFKHENILLKARLYAYILRQCFPSCNTGDAPFWELPLGPIDASVVPSDWAVDVAA